MIYAVKPGDGSAREQAASCQRVIGGLANICKEYATKRYRSNVINWGMIPFQMETDPEFEVGDYIYVPGIRSALDGDLKDMKAYVIKSGTEIKAQTDPQADAQTGNQGNASINAQAEAQGNTQADAQDNAHTDASSIREIHLCIGDMTAEEREIVKAGCLINYNRNRKKG